MYFKVLHIQSQQIYYLTVYVSRHSYHPSLKLQPLQLDLDTTKVEEEILQIHLLDRKLKDKYIDKLKI